MDKEILRAHAQHIDRCLSNPVLATLAWEATRNCNLACPHCCIPKGDWDRNKELTTDQAKRIFSDIAADFDARNISIAITGGEATLREDLVEMVRFLTGLHFRTGVDSNGVNYARDISLLDRLLDAGMVSGTIGVDGLREGYRKTRGIDGFDRIMEVLKHVCRNHPDKFITTFTVVNKHNKDEIPRLFDLLAETGITYGRVSTVSKVGRARQLDESSYALSTGEFAGLLDWVACKREEYRRGDFPLEVEFADDGWCGTLYEGRIRPVEDLFYCPTGIQVASILYDGKIAACPHIARDLSVQGDALKERFRDVWENRFTRFRDKEWIRNGQCLACDQWDNCRGGPMHYRDAQGNMLRCIYDEIQKIEVCKKNTMRKEEKRRVAIVGAENEAHCARMRMVLENRGVETTVIDTLNFPESVRFSLNGDEAKYQGASVQDIQSLYVRTVFYSHPPYDLERVKQGKPIDLDGWYSNYAAERERQSLLASWLRCLSLQGKKVVNPVDSFDSHYLKPYQIAVLRKNGIPVPKTLVTNDPDDVLQFKNEVREVVYKPVAGGGACRKMGKEDWKKERLELLKNAPVIFQEYIEGVNVRVYIIGDAVVSSGIIHTAEVDYRGNEERVERIAVPGPVAEMCRRAMRLCGMRFSGIDLKRKPDGEYVLIECNPSAMFTGFQQATGDPIDERLADYLLSPEL